jgi:SAM-dependent methyltransferase
VNRSSGAFTHRPGEARTALAGEPARHRSQAIGYAIRRLPSVEHKYDVLDLGAASGETLSFYAELPSKIYFADFFSDLQSRTVDPEASIDGFVRACHRVLPFPERTKFDLVNTWDLFNYLSLEEIGALSEYLRQFTSPIAPLVSFVWIHGRIPAQPQRYAVIDQETVEHRPTSTSQREGPRYKEPVLLKAMRGYRVSKSFLLRNGFQEYVFQPRLQSQMGAGSDWVSGG